VFTTWHFYEDPAAGKEYNLLIDSPDRREVDALIGDSDRSRTERRKGGC
jgi:hypothetical protein